MISALRKLMETRRYGQGKSQAAKRRREERQALGGKLHTGRPGDTITMSNGTYLVAKDGSFRRQ